MRVTTPGKLLVEEVVPAGYRDGLGVMDEKSVGKLFTRIAQERPEEYADAVSRLVDLGRMVASRHGREASVGPEDLILSPDLREWRDEVRARAAAIIAQPGVKGADKQKQLIGYLSKTIATAPDRIIDSMKSSRNGLLAQVVSGARGNPNQLMQILFGDVLVIDAQDRPVPIPVLHGYGEGVTPMEYWAASSGARKGSVSVQFSTAAGGYLGKQLSNIGHRLVVTEKDCGTSNGYPAQPDDPDNIGAVLAAPVGKYPAGTIITREVAKNLGDKPIRLRSLTTCATRDGVCAVCSGIREKGELPSLGEHVGIISSRALSEPITQAGLKCLHPDTEVRMADWSVKKLKEIIPGDLVLGSDVNGNCSPATVTAVYDNGIQPLFKYSYRNGRGRGTLDVVCTEAHKLLSVTQKSGCKEETLNGLPRLLPAGYKGRRVSAVLPGHISCVEGEKTEDMAFLIGLMIGDGCFTEKVGRAYLSCADDELVRDLQDYLLVRGLRLAFHKGSKCYWRVVKTKTFNGDNARNPLRSKLEEWGLWGHYAYDKALPEDYLSYTHQSLLELLSGIICADGHIRSVGKDNRLMIGLTSKKLVEQIADIVYMTSGVVPPHIVKQTTGRVRPIWTISYSRQRDIVRILNRLTLMGVKKHARTRALESATEELGSTTSRYLGVSCGHRVSSEFVGNQPTLDIEVDNKDHLFVLANGLIVSNSKHSGGVAGSDDKQVSGFKEMDQFIQVPQHFQGGAVLADVDGIVTRVQPAPAGGNYVFINGERRHVPREREVTVKQGDRITRGDMLSDGTPNPAEIAAYKGIGEARRYFVDKYGEILKRNKAGVHRRNLEAVARGFINRVNVSDVDGYNGYMLGDIVPYDQLAAEYTPREGSVSVGPSQAKDKYLERPYLHYSIGTKVTPAIRKELESEGVGEVIVNAKPPVFEPYVIRSRTLLASDPDWMTRLSGEGLKKSLLQSAQMGASSTPAGTSYFPAMANPAELDKYKGGTPIDGPSPKFIEVK